MVRTSLIPTIWEAEAGEYLSSRPGLHSKFQAGEDHPVSEKWTKK